VRCLYALVLVASSLPAQYFDLAVTDDGRLYFSTPLSTGTENARLKVYRFAGAGLELFATGTPDDNPFGSTAGAPLASGDGSITGWALSLPCAGGSCGLAALPRVFYQLQGAGVETLTANTLQISRNGRFLLASTFDARVRLIELPSQRAIELGQFIGLAGAQSIADTGAALMRDARLTPVLLFHPSNGEPRAIPGSEGALSGILSPAADRIAYERSRDGRVELVLTDPQGIAPAILASAPPRFSYQPRFANDGTLLFIDPDRQPAILPRGEAPRRLTTVEGGVQRAVLSGDGQTAWLASDNGQLLRVRIAGAAVEEVVPATPYVAPGGLFGSPGSVVRFTGSGIDESTRFRVDDLPMPIAALGPQLAYVQIPWEYPSRAVARPLIVQGSKSPFRQQFSFTPSARPTVTFEREGLNQTLLAAHQDFGDLVAPSDPAAAGETIHVFARNMGPVDRPVATGERSPDPPARVTTPLACYLFEVAQDGTPSHPQGLVVPFAGVSPGMIGIYHIDVTIPADWRAGRGLLQCHMDSGDVFFHGDSVTIDVKPGPSGLDPRQQNQRPTADR
jgi:uncharacterized protein (TIGR03437 family)